MTAASSAAFGRPVGENFVGEGERGMADGLGKHAFAC